MSGEFIDTNVFVYAFSETEPAKRSRAREILLTAVAEQAVISFQVVQETLNVFTRKIETTPTPVDTRDFLDNVLIPLWRVMPSAALYHRALGIRERYGFTFYDSLIVAAALVAGCSRLLSEDLQDGQRVEGLTIVNPFLV